MAYAVIRLYLFAVISLITATLVISGKGLSMGADGGEKGLGQEAGG
jgi:preprotein translocase subunit SecG